MKPVADKITIKHERSAVVKTEHDINDNPFDLNDVHCGLKDNQHEISIQIDALKQEKADLVQELIAMKADNQKFYFEIKSQKQTIAVLEAERIELHKKVSDQQKLVTEITRENNKSKAKIKQLMASACASTLEKENHLADDVEKNSLVDKVEYEVEAILKHSGKKGKRRFLIRWKGYSPNSDTWEKETNLNCPQMLKTYLEQNDI